MRIRTAFRKMSHMAHQFDSKPRTQDVHIQEDVDFRSMLLPDPILDGLYSCGFRRPSPIQLRAIPLARCGFDLIVHAKSGTGKTCVFTVAALDMVQTVAKSLQVLVLAPTREICLQLKDVIRAVGCKIPGLRVECFIGGRSLDNDAESLRIGCHIAVGTLGRVKHLVDTGHMNTERVRLLVLDEFDKLMDKENHDDINSIYASLPESKQILVCSATYTKAMVNFVKLYMTSGSHVTPDDNPSSVLLGIRQFVSIIPHHVDKLASTRNKEKQLLQLISTVSFDQCFVFTNHQTRAESICKLLCGKGWSADWIAGMQGQSARTTAIQNLKDQKVRVLVTTDITARGIDAYNVNLIINLDIPYDHSTYLHRMGRAGRFGSYGMVITILTAGQQVDSFRRLLGRIGGCQMSVNVIPTKKSDMDLWKDDLSQFEKIYGIEDAGSMDKTISEKSEKDKYNLSEEKLSEKSVKKCTFCSHINCSEIRSETSNCLFVTSKSCSFIEENDEVIHYDKIPLNVPLAVVGEKLIRLNKFMLDNQILQSRNINKLRSFVSDKLFTKEEEAFTSKDFNEIEKAYNEFLVNEKVNTDSLDQIIITEDKKVNTDSLDQVIITEDKEVLNQLSDTVNDILLSVIHKDEQSKNISKLVNCFDLVTWTVIDKNVNIIKDIQNSSVNIIEFKTETCENVDTENHIKVVNYGNLETFLQSMNSAEISESFASKQVHVLSVRSIHSDVKLNNIIDASKYLMDLDSKPSAGTTPATVFDKEASENQENVHNISQSSEEPAENSSSNRNDENDTAVVKQDSIDEKSPKKIKRKDGFGRNAKHISEMYPNADIEEEKLVSNACNNTSSSEGQEKVPEKKPEYKRKVKRRKPPRTDNKYEQFRKDRGDGNNGKRTMERSNRSLLNSSLRREFSEERGEEIENVKPSRSNKKEKIDVIKGEHSSNKKVGRNYLQKGTRIEENSDNSSEEHHPCLSAYLDKNASEEQINQSLKRNKGKSSVSDESYESRYNVKRKSDVRKVVKRTAIHDYNIEPSDIYRCQRQQNIQDQFRSPSLYVPNHQQWSTVMYTSQQWSEAYSRWYHMWYRQIRTISQYVEYSNYVSNMLQRK